MKSSKISVISSLKIVNILCIFVGVLVIAAPFTATEAGNGPKINVMTRNLYLGADIFKVVDAASDLASVPGVVAEVYQTTLYTNFRARAEAIADEIEDNEPDVIGLNEVETFYIQTPGDFMIGNPVKASTVVIDFYTVLDAALKARGMYYQAFSNTNADVEVPMLNYGSPTYLSDVRMVDHDYILVRKGNVAKMVSHSNYSLNVGLPITLPSDPPQTVKLEFTRGYLVVDVTVKGKDYRIACTHPEVRSGVGSVYRFVQSVQMQELLGTLAALTKIQPKTIILVGDFNSSPDDITGSYGPYPYTPPYMQAVAAGYLDSWLQSKKRDPGYTDGFSESVNDPTDKLTSRIDLIFLKPYRSVLDKVSTDVFGDRVSDMVPNLPNYPGQYLWPSDHAGLDANIKFLP
jgi:endonuclease/exonuclease/phosphatase family metal-dependent hydrolase